MGKELELPTIHNTEREKMKMSIENAFSRQGAELQ
jgi:hypothetical protein